MYGQEKQRNLISTQISTSRNFNIHYEANSILRILWWW